MNSNILLDAFEVSSRIMFAFMGVIFVAVFISVIVSIILGIKKNREIGKTIGETIKQKLAINPDGKKQSKCDYCGSIVDENGRCPNCGAKKG